MAQFQYTQFGKYLLLDRVAVGGMAEVYRSKFFGAERFEKILAIKKLLPNIAEDEEFVEMFINEAKLASQLTHSNICQIYDLGKIDGNLFIAMEYVWGKDLLQIINFFRRRKEAMPPPMASYISTRICEGIDYAYHKRGAQGMPLKIIHRDVSPQNILISYDGEVKIIDFGIAKATLHHSETQAGLLKGKFSYMSPEQVQGFPIDHRSDIFSIGTCLFEMLTSISLFRGENDFITLERVRRAEVPRLTEVNPKVPKALEKILMKSLSLEPKDRWQRAADFQDALQRFLITTPPIYTAKRLSDWMRVTFSDDIENDKTKMEEYSKLGPEVLRRSMPPSVPPAASPKGVPTPKRTLLGVGPPSMPADRTSPLPIKANQPVTVPRPSGDAFAVQPPRAPSRPSGRPPPPPGRRVSAPESPRKTPPIPAPLPPIHGQMPPGMTLAQQGQDEVVPLQEVATVQEVAPVAQGIPAPMEARTKEKQKIVAIPKTGGSGITTTTLKASDSDLEEDEEPTRALDEDAQSLDGLMKVDTLGLKSSGEPVYSLEPLKRRPIPHAGDRVVEQPMSAPQPPLGSTPPGAVLPPRPMGIPEVAQYPHGTVAIGPDGQPIFIPYPIQKPGALSSAMKWVIVMAVTFVFMVVGGVVVFILVSQLKLGAGKMEGGLLSLEENQGALILRVFPSTANVKVNGSEVPREKLSAPIVVPAEIPVEIEVWQEGYKREKFPLRVPSKQAITKEIALEELRGRIIVNSMPDKAEVFIGGQLKGETPVTIDEFPINERVTITVKKEGFEAWSEVVELNEERTERTLVSILQKAGKVKKGVEPPVIAKKMEPEKKPPLGAGRKEKQKTTPAKKEPISKPKEKKEKKEPTESAGAGGGKGEGYFIALTKPWAKVLVDGRDTGRKTPIVPTNPIKLAPGSYKVTFVLPTGESHNFNIKIKTGEQTKLIKNFEQ